MSVILSEFYSEIDFSYDTNLEQEAVRHSRSLSFLLTSLHATVGLQCF